MMYLDTNVILYAIERHSTYGNACKRIMYAIEQGQLKVGASVFVLLEVMGGLQKFNRSPRSARQQTPLFSIQENLDALLSLPIVWFEMSIATVDRVCTHMNTIHTADALHIATAELHDIREILSADKDFDRVSSLRRIDPLTFTHA